MKLARSAASRLRIRSINMRGNVGAAALFGSLAFSLLAALMSDTCSRGGDPSCARCPVNQPKSGLRQSGSALGTRLRGTLARTARAAPPCRQNRAWTGDVLTYAAC